MRIVMRNFVYPVFISVLVLQACNGNREHAATSDRDSLNVSSSPIATDTSPGQSKNNTVPGHEPDSAMIPKMFGFSGDSGSFANMRDSVLTQLKDKMGSNAGMIDSIMTMMSNHDGAVDK